ncbi:autotransporter [Janthinobacterium sp. Marseille]|nr:autotransporter outer membrane beta-barrel domain-containing protein [Janthinobacterium sp. Marseille]ABR90008.1 autotransporter [Janthinobacterium sp. Marseille]
MKQKLTYTIALLSLGLSNSVLASDGCTVNGNALVCAENAQYDPNAHGGKQLQDYDSINVTTTENNKFGYVQWSNQTQYKDFTITTSGSAADGVRLINWGPTVTFNNLTVTTTGYSADGINLGRDATDSKLSVNGTTKIKTEHGMGIRAVSSAILGSTGAHTIILNGKSDIGTKGEGSDNSGYAVYAGNNENGCGPFNLPLYACKAEGPGEIYLLGKDSDVHSITSSGRGAHAIFANGHAYIKAKNINIETSGAGAHGMAAQRLSSNYYYSSANTGSQDYAGSVELIGNVFINVKGKDAYALYVDSFSAADGKDQNGKIASIKSYDSETAQIVKDKVYRINGNMLAKNAGVIDLWMGEQSAFTGKANIENKGIINLNIRGASSAWNMDGDSTINNLSLIGSSLIYTNNTNFNPMTLTVKNDFNSSNGTIQLNPVLGDDNSLTDKLIVEGNTAGSAKVRIRNAGGSGAQTVNGIKIIDVAGTSNADFSLSGDYVIQGRQAVVGGAYAYTLHKNGINSPNDGDWYLRSQLIEKKELPLYQAGVPSYEAYPQALLELNTLATMEQRLGNRVWTDASGMSAGNNDAVRTGTWGRMEGSRHSIKPAISDSQTNYDSNVYKMQAGIDGLLHEDATGGQLIGGLFAQYINGRTATSSPFGAGKINTNAYGVGATLSWFGTNGVYVDNQVQFNVYDSDLTSRLTGTSLIHGNNGSGYALSSEIGLAIKQESGWTLTPQAQLIYSRIKFDSFQDVFGAQVTLGKGASLLGRLGLSLAHEQKSLDHNGKANYQRNYAIVNLYNEFMDGTRVDVAGLGFANRNERLWGGIGAGTSYSWADGKYMVYGEGMLNTSLKNFGDSYTFTATLGIRMAF